MPQLRRDPVGGRWVIISTERGKRPQDFAAESTPEEEGFCPFCPGNEHVTPPEIIAYRDPGSVVNGPGWKLRVVANRFPALKIEGELERRAMGMYDMVSGTGAHEVIIETPEHDKDISDLPESQVERVIWAYRDRMVDLARDSRFRHVMIFKNWKKSAGAHLAHPHSQLVATPIVPKRIEEELEGARTHYGYKERCIFCDIILEELRVQKRIVAENKNFVAFEPFAPRFPFETWIAPKSHAASLATIGASEVSDLARIFKEVLKRIKITLNAPPYNHVLHNAPLNLADGALYHWHFEIMPKLTKVAGFEWGSGFYINPVAPEDAASFLKTALV